MIDLVIPAPVFVFGSFLYRSDIHNKDNLIELWKEKWGESVFWENQFFPMKKYYSKEMGKEELLSRFFMVSTNLYPRDILKDSKLWAVKVEIDYLKDQKRTLNLDTGTLSLENLQLATTKIFIHRVYLGDGIFSDINYTFQNKSYQILSWTYPDYAKEDLLQFFNKMRKILHKKLEKLPK